MLRLLFVYVEGILNAVNESNNDTEMNHSICVYTSKTTKKERKKEKTRKSTVQRL